MNWRKKTKSIKLWSKHFVTIFAQTNPFLEIRAEEIQTEREKKLQTLDQVIRELEAEVDDYNKFKENRHAFIAERNHWKAKRDL